MSTPALRIALLGPPGAGKSAIAAMLPSLLQCDLEHANLDDDVLSLCAETGLEGPLSDQTVDLALTRLLTRTSTAQAVAIEVPHHDYIGLFQHGILDFDKFDHVIVVTAPLPTLLQRNRDRRFQVPELYITRCFGATAALVEFLRSSQISWIMLDSGLLSAAVMAELSTSLIRRTTSQSLGRLEIAPDPAAPYFGGHLISDVEWSSELVDYLLQLRAVRTALDVGCGLGLTLDRFATLGVKCWGLEGNSRVLDGPCRHKERLLMVDFQKQSIEFPSRFDLVWCVEVLEHIPAAREENVIRTIANAAQGIALVSAAGLGQPGYFHVNCRPRSYWIEQFARFGFRHIREADDFLSTLTDEGPFGSNPFKVNAFVLEVTL